MADVAAKAGVSPATVSRTINHPEKVCVSRRERVWAAITALEYVLNIDAQRLRVGRPELEAGGR